MPTALLEKLIILQAPDAYRHELEGQLKAVPRDVGLIEQRIAAEKAAIEASRGEVRELESKKKLLETEIGSAEDRLAKYKNQQSQVRKNDEYQALGHEIGSVQGQIGELEGSELEVMYAIDEARKRFAAAEKASKENISGHESRIRSLKERETATLGVLDAARAAVAAARAPIEESALRIYDRV